MRASTSFCPTNDGTPDQLSPPLNPRRTFLPLKRKTGLNIHVHTYKQDEMHMRMNRLKHWKYWTTQMFQLSFQTHIRCETSDKRFFLLSKLRTGGFCPVKSTSFISGRRLTVRKSYWALVFVVCWFCIRTVLFLRFAILWLNPLFQSCFVSNGVLRWAALLLKCTNFLLQSQSLGDKADVLSVFKKCFIGCTVLRCVLHWAVKTVHQAADAQQEELIQFFWA